LPTEDVSVVVEEGWTELPVLSTSNDELSTPVVAAPIAELLLGTADVVSAGTPFTPWASLLCDSGGVPTDVGRNPLGTVAAPEAGEIPSVPGLIVGNAEEPPSLAVVELGTTGTLLVLFLGVAEEVMRVDVWADVWVVLSEFGYSVRMRVVVMTLVLVEYVWPPEEAQKKEIVAVVGVLSTTGVMMVAVSVGSCKSVKFQPELPRPLKVVLVRVAKDDTVSIRVMWTVDVRSGPTKLVDVETTAGTKAVVCVWVVCEVVEIVLSGVDVSLGVTNMVVVAVVRDAPLEGDTPLTQLVVPETTEKTKGRVLGADSELPDGMAEMTVSVFVL
jgi:hypothetical protein